MLVASALVPVISSSPSPPLITAPNWPTLAALKRSSPSPSKTVAEVNLPPAVGWVQTTCLTEVP